MKKSIAVFVILLIFCFSFFSCGKRSEDYSTEVYSEEDSSAEIFSSRENKEKETSTAEENDYSKPSEKNKDENNNLLSEKTTAKKEAERHSTKKSVSNFEAETVKTTEKKNDEVTVSINCSTILNNMDSLKHGKENYVPADGYVLPDTKIQIEKGDTVFDALQKACDKYSIQLEYTYSSVYSTEYIEGIGQLYEFDCGSSSGWMFKVNGKVSELGASSVKLKSGDKVEWVYTCDMGNDI